MAFPYIRNMIAEEITHKEIEFLKLGLERLMKSRKYSSDDIEVIEDIWEWLDTINPNKRVILLTGI
jgi:hypothetical protein